MNRGDLADLTAFVAVADRLSFRAAASRLGVTPSALSHSMRQLEERLAVRLLNRTTRRVSVTDAGLRLLRAAAAGNQRDRRRAPSESIRTRRQSRRTREAERGNPLAWY